jgi:hypothetical protein
MRASLSYLDSWTFLYLKALTARPGLLFARFQTRVLSPPPYLSGHVASCVSQTAKTKARP